MAIRFFNDQDVFGDATIEGILQVGPVGSGLKVDNSSNDYNVGIGTASPSAKIHVAGKAIIQTSGTATAHSDTDLLIANSIAASSTSQIQILSGVSGSSNLYFSDTTAYSVGGIQYNHTDNKMTLRVAAGSKMTILSSGNVGIGTTNPNYKLTVGGGSINSIQLLSSSTGTGAFDGLRIWNTGNSVALWNYDNTPTLFGTNNNERMRITSAGNVGIGTTSPSEKLSIEGSGSQSLSIYSTDTGISGTPKTFIKLYGESAAGLQRLQGQISVAPGVNTNSGDMILSTANTAAAITERMRINGTGNVGIGTSSPFEKLTILGSGTGGSGDLLGLVYNSAFDRFVLATEYVANNDGNLQIKKVDGASGSPKVLMHFDNSGNVGIGTTSPTEALMVEGWIRVANNTGIKFNTSASSGDPTLNIDSSAHWNFLNTAGSNLLKIDNAGNVGIGTTSPISKLEISGPTGSYLSGIGFSATGTGARTYRTYIGTNGYFYFDDATGGSSRLTIDTSGNVGIGTTSPQGKIDINGPTVFRASADTYQSEQIWSYIGRYNRFGANGITTADRYHYMTSNLDFVANNNRISFYVSNGTINPATHTNVMSLTGDGNVGIGTTSPSYNLVVGDGTTDTESRFYHNDASYTSVRGYGLFMSRTTSYIRPVTTNTQNLYVGHTSNVWNSISNNANTHIFSTGATERMRITSSGNVGIGTSNPGALLDVNKATIGEYAYFGSGLTRQLRLSSYNTLSNHAGHKIDASSGNGEITLATGGTSRLVVASSGNVGIGTTSPNAKLEIGSAYGDAIILKDNRTATSGEYEHGIRFSHFNNYVNGLYFQHNDYFGITRDKFLLKVGNGTKMVVDHSGNVGIGTTSPTAPLHVIGTVRMGNTSEGLTFTAGSGIGNIIGVDTGFAGYNAIALKASANTGIYLDTADNVGIGTTSPSRKLQVDGDAGFVEGVYVNSLNPSVGATTTTELTLQAKGNQSGTIRNSLWYLQPVPDSIYGNSGLSIKKGYDGGSAVEFMRIDSGGKVGIGTTSPGSKLEVTVTDSSSILELTRTGAASFSTLISDIGAGAAQLWFNADTNDTGFLFRPRDSAGNPNNAFLIAPNGNVGIGATAPLRKLHVAGGDGFAVNASTSQYYGVYIPALGEGANPQITIGDWHNAGSTIKWDSSARSLNLDTQYSTGAGTFNITGNDGASTFLTVLPSGNVGIGNTSPTYKLTVSGGVDAGGKITYTKSAGSLDTTGYAVAGLSASYNGQSACFTFTCFGHSGGYQKIVYSCYNAGGTWITKKVINEGTNQLDVVASANGTTITFTFRSISSTLNYTPRVTVEAVGTAIISTYA